MKMSAKKRAAIQQAAVNDLISAYGKVGKLINAEGFFGEDFAFTEGQLNVHLCTAHDQLGLALGCFEDCAEERVEVHRASD